MLLDQIRELSAKLAPAEAKVAQLALAQPSIFIQTAVIDIAAQAGVSQPTVVRFCRSMGASGLRDFKLRLAAALQIKSAGPHPSVNPGDSMNELSEKVLEAGVQAIRAVGSTLDMGTLEQVLRALKQARRVDFVGIGQSALVAQDAKQKFFRFGLHCEAYSDPALQVMSAAQLQAKDLLILISASGRSPELFDAIKVARAAGAKVLSIGAPGSPVDALADWRLNARLVDDPDVHLPMLGRLQHLMIVDILAVAFSQRLGSAARKHQQMLKSVLADRRREN
jgi:RpiR family transcriptional regulator, carbohydrate utilization regulator